MAYSDKKGTKSVSTKDSVDRTLTSMRTFGGRISMMFDEREMFLDNSDARNFIGDACGSDEKLLVNIFLWDSNLPYFSFSKNLKSQNPTILKLLYLLSYDCQWEGITKQRDHIFQLLKEMYGFSLKFNCNYLLQVIEYICECNIDPRILDGGQSIFAIIEVANGDCIDVWNSLVLKTLKNKGKTLLSYHQDIDKFLKWLALEISLEGGVLRLNSTFNISTVISELISTISNVLDTYGSTASVRQFLLHLSQQERCFHLKIATKTQHRMLHVYVTAGRKLKTLWSSIDKKDQFNFDQPNFALLIDDLLKHIMSNSISEDNAEELIRSSLTEMQNLVENGMDPVSISQLLNHFIIGKLAPKQICTTKISTWTRFVRTVFGHWIILTEQWRDLTDGVPKLSITTSSTICMFLRKYFMWFAETGFSDQQHKALSDGMRKLLTSCSAGKLVDNYKFINNIKTILHCDWTQYETLTGLFAELIQMEVLNTIDDLIPTFKTTRLG